MKKLMSLVLVLELLFSFSFSSVTYAAYDEATEAANTLHELGLFNGVGQKADGTPDYDLDRAPTRQEAIAMLVRLLGKENEAMSGTWSIPFKDVADWAKPYVGYAYENGLTSGTSSTTFGGEEQVTAAQYITFVLRALNYESGTDFQWDKPYALAFRISVIHRTNFDKTSSFTRGDVAIISKDALRACMKGTGIELHSYLNMSMKAYLLVKETEETKDTYVKVDKSLDYVKEGSVELYTYTNEFTYNSYGQVIKNVGHSEGSDYYNIYDYIYDSKRLNTELHSNGKPWGTYTYDEKGRQIGTTVINSDGSFGYEDRYTYDEYNNLILCETTSGNNGFVIEYNYIYDSIGRILSYTIEYPDFTISITRTHDSKGNLISQKREDSDGYFEEYTFNPDRTYSTFSSKDGDFWTNRTYVYDDQGNLIKTVEEAFREQTGRHSSDGVNFEDYTNIIKETKTVTYEYALFEIN